MGFSGCAFKTMRYTSVHVATRQAHRVGIEDAGLDNLLNLDDGDLAGHRDCRVEVARGAAKDQVAQIISLPRLDERNIGHERTPHQIDAAVELARFLAFGDQRADSGAREQGGDAGATRAQPLGQRSLRRELGSELSRQVLALEPFVVAEVARDHAFDLAGTQQQPEVRGSSSLSSRSPGWREAWCATSASRRWRRCTSESSRKSIK